MQRKATITLDVLIEDGAILCKDDPTSYKEILEAGNFRTTGEDDAVFVRTYVASNFMEWLHSKDTSAAENIQAYTQVLAVQVTTQPGGDFTQILPPEHE